MNLRLPFNSPADPDGNSSVHWHLHAIKKRLPSYEFFNEIVGFQLLNCSWSMEFTLEPHRFFSRGKWTEIKLLGFEITCEPREEVDSWKKELLGSGYWAMLDKAAVAFQQQSKSTPTRIRTWNAALEVRSDDPFHYQGMYQLKAEGKGFEPS